MFVHVALSVFDKGQIVEDAGFSFVEETIKTAHVQPISQDVQLAIFAVSEVQY